MISQFSDYQQEKENLKEDEKSQFTKIFLKAAEQDINDEILKSRRILWWYNVRQKDSGGLRLTTEGIDFITKEAEIKTYKIDFPKGLSITPQILLWLDNFIESPYYITKKSITVLKERAAFELYLFSGDVKKMGYNKALSKRLSQNDEE